MIVFINMYFVFIKGVKKVFFIGSDWLDMKVVWIFMVIVVGILFFIVVVVFLFFKCYCERFFDENGWFIVYVDGIRVDNMVDDKGIFGVN